MKTRNFQFHTSFGSAIKFVSTKVNKNSCVRPVLVFMVPLCGLVQLNTVVRYSELILCGSFISRCHCADVGGKPAPTHPPAPRGNTARAPAVAKPVQDETFSPTARLAFLVCIDSYLRSNVLGGDFY